MELECGLNVPPTAEPVVHDFIAASGKYNGSKAGFDLPPDAAARRAKSPEFKQRAAAAGKASPTKGAKPRNVSVQIGHRHIQSAFTRAKKDYHPSSKQQNPTQKVFSHTETVRSSLIEDEVNNYYLRGPPKNRNAAEEWVNEQIRTAKMKMQLASFLVSVGDLVPASVEVRGAILEYRGVLPRAMGLCALMDRCDVYQLAVATWCGMCHLLARVEDDVHSTHIYREAHNMATRHLPPDHPMIPLMYDMRIRASCGEDPPFEDHPPPLEDKVEQSPPAAELADASAPSQTDPRDTDAGGGAKEPSAGGDDPDAGGDDPADIPDDLPADDAKSAEHASYTEEDEAAYTEDGGTELTEGSDDDEDEAVIQDRLVRLEQASSGDQLREEATGGNEAATQQPVAHDVANPCDEQMRPSRPSSATSASAKPSVASRAPSGASEKKTHLLPTGQPDRTIASDTLTADEDALFTSVLSTPPTSSSS
jgi:hypothetical protein